MTANFPKANFSLLSLSGIGTFFNALFQLYLPAQTTSQIVGLATYPSMVMAFGMRLLINLALFSNNAQGVSCCCH